MGVEAEEQGEGHETEVVTLDSEEIISEERHEGEGEEEEELKRLELELPETEVPPTFILKDLDLELEELEDEPEEEPLILKRLRRRSDPAVVASSGEATSEPTTSSESLPKIPSKLNIILTRKLEKKNVELAQRLERLREEREKKEKEEREKKEQEEREREREKKKS